VRIRFTDLKYFKSFSADVFADAGNQFQFGSQRAFVPLFTVKGDAEAVGLVTQILDHL